MGAPDGKTWARAGRKGVKGETVNSRKQDLGSEAVPRVSTVLQTWKQPLHQTNSPSGNQHNFKSPKSRRKNHPNWAWKQTSRVNSPHISGWAGRIDGLYEQISTINDSRIYSSALLVGKQAENAENPHRRALPSKGSNSPRSAAIDPTNEYKLHHHTWENMFWSGKSSVVRPPEKCSSRALLP